MGRREFVTLVGGAAVSWSITSHAQRSDKTRLIGAMRRAIGPGGLRSQRSGVGWRSWGGRKAVISESNCGGATLIRIGLGR